MWDEVLLDEVDDWFVDLARRARNSATLVAGAIDLSSERDRRLGAQR